MGTGGKKTIGIAEYVLRLRDEMTGTVQNIAGGMQSMMAPAMLAVGDMAGAMGDKIMAGIEASTDAAMDFETAFTGVRKTIDASEAEYSALSDAITKLSLEIPVAATELANIAASAGQLGIEKDNIIPFVRVIADLGVATNLTGEEAATMLARFANITQMPQTEFSNLGSAIVDLGNNFETTEAEIAAMALRLAGVGTQIGLSEADILGFATALSSVGIEAEAGGSAMSTLMIKIAQSLSEGGAQFETFAAVAGMSADQFASKWQSEPAMALDAFIRGLDGVKQSGGDVFATLEALEITEIRQRDAVLRLAGSRDTLSQAIKLGNEAYAENNALTIEAEKQYATTANQLVILQNNWDYIKVLLGDAILPIIREMVPKIIEMVQALAEWIKQNPDFVQTLLVSAAGAGTLGKAFGFITDAVMPLLTILATWKIATLGVGTTATGAVGTGGAVATGVGGTGLAGMAVAALAVGASFVAMVVGVGVAVAGILSIGVSAYKTAEAYWDLHKSNEAVSASIETYMDKLEAKGAAIDRDKARSMEHGEAMRYLAEQEAASGDSLLRAYIANAAGRAATDQEFAIAKNISLNENLLREEAAYLASKGYAESFYVDLMTLDAENTNALLEEMGVRVDGQMQGYDAIRDLSTTLAQDQIAINKEATDQILADQQNTVGLLGSIWQGLISALSSAWSAFMSMLSGAAGWVSENVGIPGMATGGMITGSGLVNVHKDELLLLPRGAEVVPKRHSEGVRAAMEGGGGGGVTININGPIVRQDSDIDAIASKVSKAIAGSSRSSMRRVGLQPNYGA